MHLKKYLENCLWLLLVSHKMEYCNFGIYFVYNAILKFKPYFTLYKYMLA